VDTHLNRVEGYKGPSIHAGRDVLGSVFDLFDLLEIVAEVLFGLLDIL